MKIRALRLEQFKKFDRPVRVEGFGDGLNLLVGPNETGKSTLLSALRAVLFERHGSKAQAIKDFAPYHVEGAAPAVSLDFEIEGKSYGLEKRFLKTPMTRLQASDHTRFEGSDAEAELKRLLQLDSPGKGSADKVSPGHFGILLTPQAGSFHQPELASETRHGLEAVVARDIADLGSQSDVDGLLLELRAERSALVDGHGKKRGRYRDVSEQVRELDERISELERRREELQEDVRALEDAVQRRDALEAETKDRVLKARLAELEHLRTDLARRQAVENRRLAAGQAIQQLEARRKALSEKHDERRRLLEELQAIESADGEAREAMTLIEQSLAEHEQARARLDDQQRERERRERDLTALGQQIERRRHIALTLSALATEVHLDLDHQALDRVTIGGETPASARQSRQVTEGLAIDIEGVGRISIEPKAEPMRDALKAEVEVDGAIARLLASLDLGTAEPEAIEVAWQDVAAEIDGGRASLSALEETLSDARRRAAEGTAAMTARRDRRRQLEGRLEELGGRDEAGDANALITLDAEIAEARPRLEEAEEALRALRAAGGQGFDEELSSDRLQAEIEAATDEIESRRRQKEAIAKEVVGLEARVAALMGHGLDEAIDQLRRRRQLLAGEHDAFALDERALSLLTDTLRAVGDEVKRTFNAPLSARLTPYIQALFPEARPLVTPDFSIRALDRHGREEPFQHLSDGTREQIAILTRLAFADMLKEQGRPALVVLDDALAFSDERRLASMLGILEKAAERMQIVVLTCRDDRFDHVDATRLAIAAAPERTSSAA